jgi:hypothetical protein
VVVAVGINGSATGRYAGDIVENIDVRETVCPDVVVVIASDARILALDNDRLSCLKRNFASPHEYVLRTRASP